MSLSTIPEVLFGKQARFRYLLLAAILLLFTLLGSREIWTQEHRWADIVFGMFYRHDFLHPYLGETTYYDKPLLSYWLIALVAKATGTLNVWALRLPSALSGLLAIWSIYSLGTKLKDKSFGLLCGWMLLTTFYFLFWARTSSADMLNLAGCLFAVAWYYNKREQAGFIDYAIFFLIVALTSLCKGLVGAIIPAIAVFTDIVLQKSWKQHVRPILFLALIPALIIYLLPFFASSYMNGDAYGQNGLYLVYRENILRYFQPFDHKGPIYTYFLYLPIYLLPWTLFFIPAVVTIFSRWKQLTVNSKWITWTLLLLFLFFTASGSRRSYYILPVVPFAILLTADWIVASKRWLSSAVLVAVTYVLLFVGVDVLPAWYYSKVGVDRFAQLLQQEANRTKPWGEWQVVMLDGEAKLNFYLKLAPSTPSYGLKGNRDEQTAASIVAAWPIIKNKPANTIFITRKSYVPLLQPYFVHDELIALPERNDGNAPVAFIPRQ